MAALHCAQHFMQQHRVPQGTYTGVAAPSSLSCTPRRASLYHQRRREYAAALFGGSALVCRNAKKEDVPSPQEPAQPQEQPAPQAEGVVADFDMEGFEGLTPEEEEEDEEVPGTYADAMNPNSKLGKAVKAACTELEELNDLETEILQQAQDVLKRFGVKGSGVEALSRPPESKDTRVGLEEMEGGLGQQPPAGKQEGEAPQA